MTPEKKSLQVPEAVQGIAEAYGADFRFSENPIGEIVEAIFSPEELTDEAVASAWRKVDRYLDTHPLQP